jgi:sulfopyruvate decarboxylase subunit alpha
MRRSSIEHDVCEVLHRHGIDLTLTVPCKYIANLISNLENDQRFDLLYPSREEEGIGIAAGAYLGGRKPIMLIQNSGLGNMVNAYCSLNQYYDIPLCLIITQRGDELERVPAQKPMGSITTDVLDLLKIETTVLSTPDELPRLDEGLLQYSEHRRSVAFITKKTFWTV